MATSSSSPEVQALPGDGALGDRDDAVAGGEEPCWEDGRDGARPAVLTGG
jgi:hypothetical protein